MLFHKTEGHGPPVVLLHPVGLDGSFWGGLPARLSRERTVISVDLMGHGQSPDAPRPGRMAVNVEEVAGLLEDAGMGPATVLGLSFGGMIAQNLALARPDLVSALILAGCPPRIPKGARARILDRGRAAEGRGMDAVIDTTLERWFTSDFRGAEAVARVAARLAANDPSNWAAAWEAVSEHDALDRLNAIDVPALVIAGGADAATPLAATEAMACALPQGRLGVLTDAPHMMQIETEEAFSDTVAGFIRSVDTP